MRRIIFQELFDEGDYPRDSDDFYDDDELDRRVEEGEISAEEAALMRGWKKAGR